MLTEQDVIGLFYLNLHITVFVFRNILDHFDTTQNADMLPTSNIYLHLDMHCPSRICICKLVISNKYKNIYSMEQKDRRKFSYGIKYDVCKFLFYLFGHCHNNNERFR